jgi:5-methylcytosine-specific restriction endonuclease McrA
MTSKFLPELDMTGLRELIRSLPDDERGRRLKRARTLVLNADYSPISTVPLHTVNWMDAVTLVYQDKCHLHLSYEDLFINSAKCSYKVPSVLVNSRYVKPKRKVEFSRTNVFLRDDYQCQYCGLVTTAPALTFDHWVPRAEGGKTNFENIVTACKPCNHKKQTQNQKRWKPRKVPYKPKFSEIEAKAKKRVLIIPDSRWIPFLGWLGPIHISDGVSTRDFDPIRDGENQKSL